MAVKTGTDVGESFKDAPGPSQKLSEKPQPSPTLAAPKGSRLPTFKTPQLNHPTTILVMLLFLNLVWSMWRTVVSGDHVRKEFLREVVGMWVIGLGVLIFAEFNAQLAMWFMVLVTLANFFADSYANMVALNIIGLRSVASSAAQSKNPPAPTAVGPLGGLSSGPNPLG